MRGFRLHESARPQLVPLASINSTFVRTATRGVWCGVVCKMTSCQPTGPPKRPGMSVNSSNHRCILTDVHVSHMTAECLLSAPTSCRRA